jgi:hypothetical protein
MSAGEPVLNQMSFFLVVAVLLDTLVIRTVVVPCCMALIGLLDQTGLHAKSRSQGASTGGRRACRSCVPRLSFGIFMV